MRFRMPFRIIGHRFTICSLVKAPARHRRGGEAWLARPIPLTRTLLTQEVEHKEEVLKTFFFFFHF